MATRAQRIVRRAGLALAIAVLLVAAYLGSLGVIHWMNGRGYLSDSTRITAETTVFAPIHLYREAELPGAEILRCFFMWAWREGLKAAGYEIRYQHFHNLRQKDDPRSTSKRQSADCSRSICWSQWRTWGRSEAHHDARRPT
jgi:hypothetical protein